MGSENSREVFIVSGCRTPIGEFGGSFRDIRSDDLSVAVAQEVLKRAGIAKSQVEDVIWGECHQQLDQSNTARVMAMKAGFPKEVSGVTINRVCTSAMQAIIFGTQMIRLGDADVILAGGGRGHEFGALCSSLCPLGSTTSARNHGRYHLGRFYLCHC